MLTCAFDGAVHADPQKTPCELLSFEKCPLFVQNEAITFHMDNMFDNAGVFTPVSMKVAYHFIAS